MKRPRGEIARQAEQTILTAIDAAAHQLEQNNQNNLAEIVRIKRDQLETRWNTQQRVAAERKSMRNQSEQSEHVEQTEQPSEQPA